MRFHRLFGLCLVALTTVFVSCCGTGPSKDIDSTQLTSELQALTQARLDANIANDRTYYERLLAENFRMLYPSGQTKTKRQFIEGEHFGPESAGHRGSKATITEFRAVLEGEVAVATYQLVEHLPLGTQRFDHPMTRLDTYVRNGNDWKLLSMSVADKPSWPEAAKISPRRLAEYTGIYDQGGGLQVVVTNEAGHLMAQMAGQEKAELFPENDTTFFDTTDENPNARSIFERDASGKVIRLVYRAFGQKINATKIK